LEMKFSSTCQSRWPKVWENCKWQMVRDLTELTVYVIAFPSQISSTVHHYFPIFLFDGLSRVIRRRTDQPRTMLSDPLSIIDWCIHPKVIKRGLSGQHFSCSAATETIHCTKWHCDTLKFCLSLITWCLCPFHLYLCWSAIYQYSAVMVLSPDYRTRDFGET
jgi:hypothetical protein